MYRWQMSLEAYPDTDPRSLLSPLHPHPHPHPPPAPSTLAHNLHPHPRPHPPPSTSPAPSTLTHNRTLTSLLPSPTPTPPSTDIQRSYYYARTHTHTHARTHARTHANATLNRHCNTILALAVYITDTGLCLSCTECRHGITPGLDEGDGFISIFAGHPGRFSSDSLLHWLCQAIINAVRIRINTF